MQFNQTVSDHQAETPSDRLIHPYEALAVHALEAHEQERRRVALVLHEDLAQSLLAIKINLERAAHIRNEKQHELIVDSTHIVANAIQQLRDVSTALRPTMLDHLGLIPALNSFAERSSHHDGFAVRFFHECGLLRPSSAIETACFRIVEEALRNVTQHASAKVVRITLVRDADDLLLRVQDDGIGFDVTDMHKRAEAGACLGMLSMQVRARQIGGQLGIESQPGAGSVLSLRCPWLAPPPLSGPTFSGE